MSFRLWMVAAAAGWLLMAPAALFGAEPVITALSVRGLTTGGTTRLTITGRDLLPEPRLVLPVPIESQSVVEGSKATQVTLDVRLPATAPGGLFHAWLATAEGLTAPFALALDPLPNQPFAGEVSQLPVALCGALTGTQVFETRFQGRAGQRLVVDVESRRLGANLKPVVRLHDPRKVQLAWAQGSAAIFGDARLEAVLPDDGTYTIELHDAMYRGAAPGHFRLKLGDLRYVDLVYPLGVSQGANTPVEFIPAARLGTLDHDLAGEAPLPWAPLTGARPRVIASDLTEVVEQPQTGDVLQTVAVPAGINGRLSAAGEVDRYVLSVRPGQRLRFDLLAERVGSPIDGVLRLRDAQGKQLAENDDRAGTTDPGFDYTVPQGTEQVVVEISDLNRRGGEYFVYRLAVTELGQPSFTLAVLADRLVVPSSGRAIVPVRVSRAGYNGPVQLACKGMPPQVVLGGTEIPAGATDTLLLLAVEQADLATALASVVGTSVGLDPPLRRAALAPEVATSKYQPWLRQSVALAITHPAPLAIDWEPVSADPTLPLGSSLKVRAALDRGKSATGPVRLSLLTSQIMPSKQVDGPAVRNRPGPKQTVDDPDRALRLAAETTLPSGESTAELTVLVPGDLPDVPYDLALRAELLSADGKTVLASAVTDVWRLRTSRPFSIELLANRVNAKAGGGETGALAGKVVRQDGFNHPVTVMLERLPAGLVTPSVTVPSDIAEFRLPVAFQYPAPLGKLAGVRLVGTAQVSDTVVVRSTERPVEINVVRGEAPPALLPIFEDDPEFAAQFREGDGQLSIESEDRYSGTIALKATPQQVVQKVLPGLGYPIRENPGPGEYRYLRFAWKKTDGVAVVLQLYSGDFQVERVVSRAATAYEAGTGSNKLRIPTLRLSDQLPSQWQVLTRDLYADFGEITINGLGLVAGDGGPALFDHLYLAQSESDFDNCPPPATQAE